MPLWLCFKQNFGTNRGQHPFRFLAAWLTHSDFGGLVKDKWDRKGSWGANITSLIEAIKIWNKNVFGNITYRKYCLLNRLHGISRSLQNGWNPYLLKLQKKLWNEYEVVLYQEEVTWFQ